MFTTLTEYFPVPKYRKGRWRYFQERNVRQTQVNLRQPNFNKVLNILSWKSDLTDAKTALLQCVILSLLSVVPLKLALTQNYPNSVEHIYLHHTDIIYLIGLDEPEVKKSLDAF